MPKMVFQRGVLVSSPAIYQTKCPFTVLSALFCSSGRCSMIPDYSRKNCVFWCFQGVQKRSVVWNGLIGFYDMLILFEKNTSDGAHTPKNYSTQFEIFR